MATKEQVLPLLKLGLSPQQIAKKLKCKDAYVRAVRAREFGNGLEVQRRHERKRRYGENREAHLKYHREYFRERYATDPEFRARILADSSERHRKRYWTDSEYRERTKRYYRDRYRKEKEMALR